MKNTLTDLHNHLFEQLERLNDEELKGDQLNQEISRAKAMTDVAGQIIANGNLALKSKMAYTNEIGTQTPKMLEMKQ